MGDTDIATHASHMVDGVAPVLSSSTPPVADTTHGGDSVGEPHFLTLTFGEVVNGLLTGSENTKFTVPGAGVAALWSGTDGETSRRMT